MAIYNENTTISGTQTAKVNGAMRDYPIYQGNYYSGADISIYFGDTWVDEISAIQFQVDEKVAPIYGYADYIYSKLARGNRIAMGRFRINYTESGYLEAIIQRLTSSNLENIPDVLSRDKHVIESQTVVNNSFEAFAKDQEDSIWGEHEKEDYKATSNSPGLSKYTFDIIIGYGATAGSTSAVNGYAKPSSTLQILKNVALTGRTQIIDTSDNVIQEEYTFIAQDIISSI